MYKIVETIERGSKQLTAVPKAWEKQGVLFWPKMKAEKLIKIGTSIPEDSWFQMGCTLKRNGLETYGTAEQELRAMLEKEDSTEAEEQEVIVQRKKRVRVILPKKNAEYDFNEVAAKAACMNSEQLATTSNTLQYNMSEKITVADSSPQNVIFVDTEKIMNDNYSIEESYNSTATDVVTNEILQANTSTLDNHLSTIIENQGIIINNQNAIMESMKNLGTTENQLKILQQLSKFEAMTDVIAEKMSNISSNKHCSCKKSSQAVENVYIDCIEAVEQLDALESKLKDKDVMKENIERLSYVCGKRGDGHGINNCYILVDRMFSRKFMTLCSWAGGARGKKEKVAFKMYKNVISLFFNVVHLSDNSFTHKDCVDFFKNVIRNSTRRSKSDLSRTSAIKRRSKKLIAPNENNEMEETENNDIAEEAMLDEDNNMGEQNN